ncbi:hypothetical protein JKP88DRAFT_352045 [Tribonema minus]|uniref:Uncharacterized protein n=1 Tax=Tribonema minus TaxID=303371 RepID=A0A836CMJ9_9STRA|nr:hypothetical protein JKP88DRAFT_352045 [Tribonema minus]
MPSSSRPRTSSWLLLLLSLSPAASSAWAFVPSAPAFGRALGPSSLRLATSESPAADAAATSGSDAVSYETLQELRLFRAADGTQVALGSLWGEHDTAVVAFLRLKKDWAPRLDWSKLIVVGIGTPDKAAKFGKALDFPIKLLYCDPDTSAYTATGMIYGTGEGYLSFQTLTSCGTRTRPHMDEAMRRYIKIDPDKPEYVNQQGGVLAFKGRELAFVHRDQGPGMHADLPDVLEAIGQSAW